MCACVFVNRQFLSIFWFYVNTRSFRILFSGNFSSIVGDVYRTFEFCSWSVRKYVNILYFQESLKMFLVDLFKTIKLKFNYSK